MLHECYTYILFFYLNEIVFLISLPIKSKWIIFFQVVYQYKCNIVKVNILNEKKQNKEYTLVAVKCKHP